MVLKMFRGVAFFAVICILTACWNHSKEELVEKGIKLFDAGDYGGALVCFKNALERDEDYPQARYHLGRAYLNLGKYEHAEREFRKVSRPEAFPEISLDLAEIYLATGRNYLALASIDEYLKTKGEIPRSLVLRGRVMAMRGDLPEAAEWFEKALRIEPGHVPASLGIATVHLEGGRVEASRTVLNRLLEEAPDNRQARFLLARLEMGANRWDEAMKQYSRLAEIDPKDPHPVYLTALLHLQSGDKKKGRQFAGEFSSRFPDNPLGFLLRGMSLYREEKYEQAVVELHNAARYLPDPISYYLLGLCHYHLGQYEMALNQMQKVLDLNPDSGQTRMMVAMILLQQRRVDDAIREIRTVLSQDEGNGLAHNILGSAYLAQGKSDEAMAEFNRAIEMDPTLADVHLKKGMFSLARGRTSEGESEIIRALSIAPEVLDTRVILASHYLGQQNHAAALKILQEGIKGKSADAVLYNLMANVHFAQQQSGKAIEALEAAKRANPDYFAPFFSLATFHASRGDYDRAAAEYAHVLRADPGQVRALVGMGQVLEIKGEEPEAAGWYEKASATGEIGGVLAAAGFHARKGRGNKALAIVEEAIRTKRHPSLLELRGRLLMQQGREVDAVSAFEALESVAPGHGYPAVVQIYLRQGTPEKAEAVARKALQMQPQKPYSHLLMASVHEGRQDLFGALTVLQQARSQVGETQEIDLRIGAILERQGKLREATDLYRKVVENSPEFHPARFALATVYQRIGNEGEAKFHYERILQTSRNFAPAQNNLAYLYADDPARKEDALRLALQAFRQSPERPEIMDTLGYALLRNGRPAQAVQMLEKAAQAMPGQPAIQYHLMEAYKALGNTRKAIEAFRKALESGDYPENSFIP